MTRYANRKDDNQEAIVTALRAAGFSVYVMHEPFDLLVGRAGKAACLEVKDSAKSPSRRKLTPMQEAFKYMWRGPYDIVTTPAEAIAAATRRTAP